MANYNLENPLVSDVMTDALSDIDEDMLKDVRRIQFAKGYASIKLKDDTEMIYDQTAKEVMPAHEWYQKAHKYYCRRKEVQDRALEKAGALEAYNAVEEWLTEHAVIRQVERKDISGPDFEDYEVVVERELKYGYRLNAMWFEKDCIVLEICCYDRAIKMDCNISDCDNAYLIYKDGEIKEADYTSSEEGMVFTPIE